MHRALFGVLLWLSSGAWAQSPTVGRLCSESTECNDGAYCASNKRCACLTSFVDISGYCWRKINPGEAGCTQNRQCEAVWPDAYCSSGECKCGNNQPPFPTLDGLICVNYGECPIGQHDTKFQEQGQTLQCTFGVYFSPGGTNAIGPPSPLINHVRPYECPETYDCICSNAGCTDSTFCCPSRAYSCTLNYEEGEFPGSGGGTVNRWYYDPITAECKQFSFRGTQGNSNNFVTKEHCESYCKESCERGRPQYSVTADGGNAGSTGRASPLPVTCDTGSSGSASCLNTFECKTVGTRNYCCPTVDTICSRNGGVSYNILQLYEMTEPTTSAGYDPGYRKSGNSATFSRFYYDRASARCRSFTWLGQAGNFNNFLTESQCDGYCSKTVCTAGVPLKDTTGYVNVNCGGSDTNCPTSHECKSNLCCPRPQFVCKLSMATGSCASYSNRWWYNAATGNCEEFTYSGCQGNSNNFASYTDCQSFCKDARVEPQCIQGKALKDANLKYVVCGGATGTISTCPSNYYCHFDGGAYGCCPTQSFTCSQSYSEGRECGPEVTRWYYDTTTRKCQTYTYKGCDGNSNNFATQQDCNEYCRVDNCPDGGSVKMEANGVARSCSSDTDCDNTHYCTAVSVSTGGNTFTSSNFCCPSKSYVCSLYKDSGTRCTSTTIPRWWFNPLTRTCETFTYNGCAGNRNNFASRSQCNNYCISSACPSGTTVAQDSNSGQITICQNTGLSGVASDGCRDDFTCYNSQLLGQNVCCGSPAGTENICPSESRAFISALTLQPQQCTPNVLGSCPGGYFCWYSTGGGSVNAYYCCKDNTPQDQGLCPPQLKALPGKNGAAYRFCSPSAANGDETFGCGVNEYCQFAEAVSQYICCGSQNDLKPSWSDVCPPEPLGLTPYYVGRDYRQCNPLANEGTTSACPRDAACLFINNSINYICCRYPPGYNSTTPAFS